LVNPDGLFATVNKTPVLRCPDSFAFEITIRTGVLGTKKAVPCKMSPSRYYNGIGYA
jgi:hypothetical protein